MQKRILEHKPSKEELNSNITEKKKTRARSKEEKAKKFEEILDKGIELYCENKFSLKKLAKHMAMSMPNLYHYVKSKRELWIAIRKRYFKTLQDELHEIIKNHKGTHTDLLIKLATMFLDFSEADYRRFDFMFLIPIPSSKKVGPIEKSYKPFNLLTIINEVIQKAIDAGEIKEENANGLTFFFYQLELGTAIVQRHIIQIKEDVSEPVKLGSKIVNAKENRKFFLEQLRKILILMSLWR